MGVNKKKRKEKSNVVYVFLNKNLLEKWLSGLRRWFAKLVYLGIVGSNPIFSENI